MRYMIHYDQTTGSVCLLDRKNLSTSPSDKEPRQRWGLLFLLKINKINAQVNEVQQSDPRDICVVLWSYQKFSFQLMSVEVRADTSVIFLVVILWLCIREVCATPKWLTKKDWRTDCHIQARSRDVRREPDTHPPEATRGHASKSGIWAATQK